MKSLSMETNAADLARRNHWRAQRVRTTLHEANKLNAKLLKQKAREDSSLTDHSLADLARMGHPYAKRAPNPPHPPYMVHRQTGKYIAGFFSRTGQRGDTWFIEFGNNADPVTTWLEGGTKKMIPRRTVAHTLDVMRRELQLNNRRAYQSAIGLHGAAAASRARAYLRGLQ